MKRPLLGLALLPAALIQGCATTYGCKGFPNNPICKSAVEAYKATEDSKPVNPAHPEQEATDTSPLAPAPLGQKSSAHSHNKRAKASHPVMEPINDPAVVRMPPRVMRIWIAPWEDSDGDLQSPGFIFTELEPRRWVIGQPALKSHPTLTPLQVSARKSVFPTASAPTSLADPLQTSTSQVPKGRLQVEEPDYE